MSHKVRTYHDVQALGLEKLRNAYASAGLSIRPRSGINKIEMIKEFARGLGLNPEEILVKQAFSEPDMKYVDPQERERADIRTLMLAIKADLKAGPREPEPLAVKFWDSEFSRCRILDIYLERD